MARMCCAIPLHTQVRNCHPVHMTKQTRIMVHVVDTVDKGYHSVMIHTVDTDVVVLAMAAVHSLGINEL